MIGIVPKRHYLIGCQAQVDDEFCQLCIEYTPQDSICIWKAISFDPEIVDRYTPYIYEFECPAKSDFECVISIEVDTSFISWEDICSAVNNRINEDIHCINFIIDNDDEQITDVLCGKSFVWFK